MKEEMLKILLKHIISPESALNARDELCDLFRVSGSVFESIPGMEITKEQRILMRAACWISEDANDGCKEAKEIVEGLEELVKLFAIHDVIKMLPLTGKRLEILEKTYNRLLSKEPTKL